MFDVDGEFAPFGGAFIPEILVAPLEELKIAYEKFSSELISEQKLYLKEYIGRETPLTFANRLTEKYNGAKIYLKREDLNHTGAHKINNAIGQAILAKKMGKTRIIAETGAGQHGVATATVCAKLNLKCTIYMGKKDAIRQAPNVRRMKLLGAVVVEVSEGGAILKDAINEALRDWVTHPDSYYLIGSALGPEPYPQMVRDFQTVIGQEAKRQILAAENRLPDYLIACVGGGSNAIGLFHPFLKYQVKMIGVEAAGKGIESDKHAVRMGPGTLGFFQGTKSILLQDDHGNVKETHSISAGLDYPAIGPEHAYLASIDRVHYTSARDDEALKAFKLLCEYEGIIPALESSHAIAEAIKLAPQLSRDSIIIINLSGRGDKDLEQLEGIL